MIDTSIQFNNHNSYKATEDFWQKPFGVELMTHITIAAIFYATSPQSATNRIRVIFLDENGARVQVSNHAIGIGIDAARQSVTVAVPAGAKKAQIGFLAGNYWWAEAKAEEGETATAYAINAAGQLTYLTPNGVYTHTLQAKQIILTGGDRLPDRLLTMNASLISLRSGIDGDGVRISQLEAGSLKLGNRYNGVKIDQDSGINIASLISGKSVEIRLNTSEGLAYYSGGAFKGGLKLVDGQVSSVAGVVTGDSDLKRYVKVGSLPTGGGGLAYYNRNIFSQQNKFVFAISELVGGSFAIIDSNDKQRISIDHTGATSFNSKSGAKVLALDDTSIKAYKNIETGMSITTNNLVVNGSAKAEALNTNVIRNSNGVLRMSIPTVGDFVVYDNTVNMVVWVSKSGNFAQLHLPSSIDNAIGVDATGAYKIVHGTKTYL